jgi:hypothetical protein
MVSLSDIMQLSIGELTNQGMFQPILNKDFQVFGGPPVSIKKF